MSEERRWTIGEVMSAHPHTIGAEQTLARARQEMVRHGVRQLPVLHGGALVGVVTERDVELLEGLEGLRTEVVRVEEVMMPEVYVVHPSTPLVEVAREMVRRKLGYAIVSAHETDVAGIFTTLDAMKLVERLLG